MSKGKDMEAEDQNSDRPGNHSSPIKRSVLVKDSDKNSSWINSDGPQLRKMSTVCETEAREGSSWYRIPSSQGRLDAGSSGEEEPQDADYSHLPQLSDELENLILARAPRLEYWKFLSMNKRILALLRTGELFKIRREIGVKEPLVFIFATGDMSWWVFDRQFRSRRKLPELPADPCFSSGDKESLCAGTHLIISGREIDGVVVWRYDLESTSWTKGPLMINPRCLFASASSATYAFVAGGVTETRVVLNSAEKYNPCTKSWDPLPRMLKNRKLCSGCYMDNKFYVIGGRDEEGKVLTCGEAYDDDKKAWELIPNMLEDTPVASFQSPPLVAVVNNELYSLETTSNELKVYLKCIKTWKKLGPVPVRADSHKGWGVAFKSLGDELLVIGASTPEVAYTGEGMAIYTCCPDPKANELHWTPLGCGRSKLSNFILNCSVMMA